ncbi:MAG: DegT/DnrJ/EryC1/StrS family aminotransferase [Candidatus Anammoxibacter sp.]
MNNISIPQTNPKASYLSYKEEIDRAIANVLDSGWYILGREVSSFEDEFSKYIGVNHTIGVANGTDALELALRACGIGHGDTVVTVSNTAVATCAAIVRCGAIPQFVDIVPETYTLDPAKLEDLLKAPFTKKPKAVIVVHLYGNAADVSAIISLADKYEFFVIEDCAQAHGAELNGRKLGGWGNIAAFSFYPTKNLGAIGDGGAIVTNDSMLYERVRLLREYGWKERYISDLAGTNSRLDELQAAILRVKLKYLKKDNQRRLTIAEYYTKSLQQTSLKLPCVADNVLHVFHQYVIRSKKRDQLREALREEGIGTLIHYPVPIHNQPAYEKYNLPEISLVNTEKAALEILSLPMYPQLSGKELDVVVKAITSHL